MKALEFTSKAKADLACRAYTALVSVAGISLWVAAAVLLATRYAMSDQLMILVLVPLTIVTGMFPNTFPLPSVLKTLDRASDGFAERARSRVVPRCAVSQAIFSHSA